MMDSRDLRNINTEFTAESAFDSNESIDSFIEKYSVFPCNIEIVKSLLRKAVSYKSLKIRREFIPSIASIGRSNTFDHNKIQKIDQETLNTFVSSSNKLGSCCLVKHSDTQGWNGYNHKSTFEDISLSIQTSNDASKGIIVCCYDKYRSHMGLEEDLLTEKASSTKNALMEEMLINRDYYEKNKALFKEQKIEYKETVGINCVTTDILSVGGFYSPLHLDNGGTSRRHILAGQKDSSAKLIIISNSMAARRQSEIKNALRNISTGIIDVEAELCWILRNHVFFDFVLQEVGEEVEHCGAYYHAFVTLINPILNPRLVCLSLGYKIVSSRALAQFINHAPEDVLGYQNNKGEIVPEDLTKPAKRAKFQVKVAKDLTDKPKALHHGAESHSETFIERSKKSAKTRAEKAARSSHFKKIKTSN
jgi:hypothetical protein